MSLNHDGHLPSRSNREDPMMFSVFFFFFFFGLPLIFVRHPFHWDKKKNNGLPLSIPSFGLFDAKGMIGSSRITLSSMALVLLNGLYLGKCSHPFKNYSLCSVIYNCIFFLKNGSRVIQGAAFKITTIWSRGRLKNIYTWSFRNNLSSFSFCFSISWT